jgi:Alpha/beta hydrolase domain
MPEVSIPLASNTGWNLREAGVGSPSEMYSMIGSWIPFPLTKSQRELRRDPRTSVEERYASREDYLKRIEAAAESLVEQRYLLEQDVPRLRDRAGEEWNYIHNTPGN